MILGDTANGRAASLLEMDRWDPETFDAHTADVFFLMLGDDATAMPPGFVDELRAVPQTVLFASHERELAPVADVVFPSPTWAERWGAYLNLEGRIQQAAAVVKTPSGVRDERDVLQDLLRRLGRDASLERAAILPDFAERAAADTTVVTGRSAASLTVKAHKEQAHRV
jgi:NADH dehydrogenase/NADH:ubiquinone oxidoreductase subunit G